MVGQINRGARSASTRVIIRRQNMIVEAAEVSRPFSGSAGTKGELGGECRMVKFQRGSLI